MIDTINKPLSEADQAAQAWTAFALAKHGGAAVKQTPATVQLTRASDVTMRPIDWLWHGFLPRGMLTLLAGLPGCGKSTLALALATTVTNAGRWPDATPMRTPSGVLI